MVPWREYLAISVKYVRGENDAIIFPQTGISSIGIKIPLMNTRGNFTKVESIIILETMLVGGEDNISPKEEKQKAAKTNPNVRIKG